MQSVTIPYLTLFHHLKCKRRVTTATPVAPAAWPGASALVAAFMIYLNNPNFFMAGSGKLQMRH